MSFEPKGLKFFDLATKKNMILVEGGSWDGWLCYQHPDGQWVTLREATEQDKAALLQTKCGSVSFLTLEQLAILSEETRLEIRKNCMPQVDALLFAGWSFELPNMNDSEPWQWSWRSPAKRANSKGRKYWSTSQAFNALKKSQEIKL